MEAARASQGADNHWLFKVTERLSTAGKSFSLLDILVELLISCSTFPVASLLDHQMLSVYSHDTIELPC